MSRKRSGKKRGTGDGNRKAATPAGESTQKAATEPSPTRRDSSAADRPDGWPRWAAPLVYAAVTLLLFREFVFSGDMLLGIDTLGLGYVAREFFASALRTFGFPYWNPYILGGTPFLESLAGGDSLYPTSLLLLFMQPHRALGWKLVIHVFLAGLFMYGWIRSLGMGRPAAFLGGLAYLMAPMMVTLVYPGHDGKMFVTALTPLAFWMVEGSFSRDLRWLVGLAAVIGVVLLSTHFQMAYFLFGAMGVYAAYLAIRMGRREAWGRAGARFGMFLTAAVVGAGVGAVQFLPAVEYVTSDSRRTATTTAASEVENIAYSSSWSLHPEEVFSLAVPEFVGVSIGGGPTWTQDTYWGRNQFKLNHEYFGLAVLLLALLAFGSARRQGAHRWFFLTLGSVALLYALGGNTPIWRIFYEIVPGVPLFRVPSIAIFLVGFSFITLAAMGVDRAVEAFDAGEAEAPGLIRRLWIGAGVMVVLLLMAASGILFSLWTGVIYAGIVEPRAAVLQGAQAGMVGGFFKAALIAAAAAGAWFLRGKEVLTTRTLTVVLALILALDAGRVDAPFIQTLDFDRWAAPDRSTAYLAEQVDELDPFRVFSMVGLNGQDVKPALHGIELAGGHHPNDLARYRTLIGMEGSEAPTNLFQNPELLRLLNVRYLLWPVAQMGAPFEGQEPVASDVLPDGRVLQATYAFPGLPRARLGAGPLVLDDERAMEHMLSPAFSAESQVVLAEAPPAAVPAGPVTGEVTWVSRTPNQAILQVRSDGPALLVVADNWTEAWRASVDGQPAPVLRAYTTLRAIPVPAGQSEVRMWYDASGLRSALMISLAALAALLATWTVLTVRRRSAARFAEELASTDVAPAQGV